MCLFLEIMPSNKVSKKVSKIKAWTETDMWNAMEECKNNPLASRRAIAKAKNIGESTLRIRLKEKEKRGTAELMPLGRRPAFPAETEKLIAQCIEIKCKNGFSPTHSDLQNNFQKDVLANKLKVPFKDGRPGRDWMKGFMTRNKLSLKKASMLSLARRSNPSTPFIIHDLYDQLEKIYEIWTLLQFGTVMRQASPWTLTVRRS